MSEQQHQAYFSHQSLARFVAAQGKTLEKVVCHLWQNTVAKEPVELIDNLELHFTDKQKLVIGCNEDGSGLDTPDFDFAQESEALKKEFEGRIKLFAINASGTTMWEKVIGLPLQMVRLSKEEDNYIADSLVLDFGDEKREISVGPYDGLVIDYFEE